jgi:hypothetical protein
MHFLAVLVKGCIMLVGEAVHEDADDGPTQGNESDHPLASGLFCQPPPFNPLYLFLFFPPSSCSALSAVRSSQIGQLLLTRLTHSSLSL